MKGDRGEPATDAEGRAPSCVITRLTRDERDITKVDMIARASFDEPGFSAERELERPWARIWAARAANENENENESEGEGEGEADVVVGFLETWHVADELHILNIATEPQARRRGFATALMNAALAYAAENGVRLVLLEVRRSNEDARRLYRRLGFTDGAVRRGYYADNGEDAIEMLLTLSP
jgi:ribosomal-protein-alanine N-acetyltransferase